MPEIRYFFLIARMQGLQMFEFLSLERGMKEAEGALQCQKDD